MQESIGKKIKRIREELKLGQKEINMSQTHLSQIETERITNPKESALTKIAQSFGMNLDELIDNTNWKRTQSSGISDEFGFSPMMVDVTVDDNGNIAWRHKTFPLYNSNGEKNEYCPWSGLLLISNCDKCKRPIEDIDQIYCSGCGDSLFLDVSIGKDISDIMSDNRVFTDQDICGDAIHSLVNKIDRTNKTYRQLKKDFDLAEDILKGMENKMKELKGKELEKWWKKKKKAKDSLTGLYEKQQSMLKWYNEYENKYYKTLDHMLHCKFEIQVAEASVKKLKIIVNNLEPLPPLTIKESREELFSQLSNMMVSYISKVIDPYGIRKSMEGFTDAIGLPQQSKKSENKKGLQDSMAMVDEMNKILKKVENMKDKEDPEKLVKIMKDFMELQDRSDEEISDKSITKENEEE